jgi:hypothetical protein
MSLGKFASATAISLTGNFNRVVSIALGAALFSDPLSLAQERTAPRSRYSSLIAPFARGRLPPFRGPCADPARCRVQATGLAISMAAIYGFSKVSAAPAARVCLFIYLGLNPARPTPDAGLEGPCFQGGRRARRAAADARCADARRAGGYRGCTGAGARCTCWRCACARPGSCPS